MNAALMKIIHEDMHLRMQRYEDCISTSIYMLLAVLDSQQVKLFPLLVVQLRKRAFVRRKTVLLLTISMSTFICQVCFVFLLHSG